MVYAIVDSKEKVEIRTDGIIRDRFSVFVGDDNNRIYIPNLDEVLLIKSNDSGQALYFLPPSLKGEPLNSFSRPSKHKLISKILDYYDRNEMRDRLYIIPEIDSKDFANTIMRATNNNVPAHRTLAEFVFEYESFRKRF